MTRFRVPVRVSVAPVQTYQKIVRVDAASREAAARIVKEELLDGLISSPGWKAAGGRMEPVQPDKTTYETYLDELSLDEWVSGDALGRSA